MSNSIATKLKEDGIVPDVLPTVSGNIELVTVVYGEKKVEIGSIWTPRQAIHLPNVLWNAEDNSLYTLIFTDPDVPRRSTTKKTQCKHWLVVNIPGSDVSKGHVDSEYFGPGPAKKGDLHRYTFLVYKQSGKVAENSTVRSNELKNRFLFNAKEFAEENQLGSPVAVNYFQAEYDDSVPSRYLSFVKCPVFFKNICPALKFVIHLPFL